MSRLSSSKTDGASTAQGDSASSVTRWLIVVSVAVLLLLGGYRGAVAAMAAPAVQYHRHLIEQCTNHVDPDRDARTIRYRPAAAGDRHGSTNDKHRSGSQWPEHW